MNTKKTKRGTFDYCSADGMVVVRWEDNRIVTMLANYNDVLPTQKALCSNKEMEVECPSVVTAQCTYGR